MQTYADSSFLVSLAGEDANSEVATRYMACHAPDLPFNPLHRLEVRNAMRLAVKYGTLDVADSQKAFRRIEADLREGFFVHEAINWTESLRRAEALSQQYTETLGTRAADILHVAIALENGARRFLSFDVIQRQLARAEGLEVLP